MRSSWRKYLAERAPRYTSYPSALQFNPSVTADDYAAKLEAVDLYEPLSIYVHVPFCKQLCWYCGCNMRVENNYNRALDYLDTLIDEIRMTGGFLGGAGRLASIHFGGGTPNFFSPDALGRILNAIELELGLTDDARLAIEIDPRLASRDDITALAELGFSRMSLGVQDIDPAVQQAINRVQSYEMIEAGVSAMREAGVNDISFDLLYGLPKQTARGFASTLAKTIALAPDRVSVFGYAHLPSAIPRQRLIQTQDLPGQSLRHELAAISDEMLTSAGYQSIGFDHYAKPHNSLAVAARKNRLRRNFQGFTDEIAKTMIGFGATAISFIDGLYAQNEKDPRSYREAISERRLPVARGVQRTDRDEIVAAAVSELLCRFEADLTPVLALADAQETEMINRRLGAFEQDGVISRNGAHITLTSAARPLSRAVAMAFDPYACGGGMLARAG